jgi:endoglucanase
MIRLAAIFLFSAIVLSDAGNAIAEEQVAGINSLAARLGRGVNLGNALEAPQEGEWGVRIQASYFREIKAAGFDSVRLPVKWSGHAQAAAPYTIDKKFAERVDWAVDQALANGLNIIVNVHHYDEVNSAPDEHLPRLVALWRQIAARYRDRPGSVYFELLNEPHGELSGEKWNAAIPQILAAVRETNPDRPVILGPGDWNNASGLEQLKLPPDRNLIVTVHFYGPFEFTHQGASWVDGSDKWKGRTWSGSDAEKAEITSELETAAAWGKTHNRPMFLGEFGAYQEADMESRARWTRFVVREAERLGMTWSYWEFCAGFGAYDPEKEEWRQPIKAALLK